MQVLIETTRALGITSQAFRSRVDGLLAPHGLSYNHFSMLVHLTHQHQTNQDKTEQGQTISQLADAFETKQPGVSKMVTKFEAAGWVQTQSDPADIRKKLVSITTAGAKLVEDTQIILGTDVIGWFDGWSDADQAKFLKLLNRLNESLRV